jgi:hypothetical protein
MAKVSRGVNVKNPEQSSSASTPEHLINAIGGAAMDGSGFEQDDPEPGFTELED